MVAVGATSEYFVTCTLCCQSYLSFPFLLLDVSKERWKLTVPTAAYGRRYVVRLLCFFVYGRRESSHVGGMRKQERVSF